MSLTPAFEIGLWNAWIPVLYPQLIFIFGILAKREMLKRGLPDYTKAERKIYRVISAMYYLAIVYSIFLPLELGTVWFYIGLPIFLLGEVIFTLAAVSFGTTPIDKPVTRGIYHHSRHPLYLAQYLIFIGVSIASASWVFLLFAISFTILQHILTIPEERTCLAKYSDSHREYMNKTPKYIGRNKNGL